MGGILKSVGGLLGLGGGPEAPQVGDQSFNNVFTSALRDEALKAPISSTEASSQVQADPILGQLFGQGGALSNAIGKEQELQNKGFNLTQDDKEAYGQAAGDIARQFGGMENDAAQSLASRGLAAAPSGAAGALFSGLAGNKNEQLAKAQMQIANQRMQNTMQRIGQQQQLMSQLGQQAGNAVNDQFGRNLSAQQQKLNALSSGAGLLNQEHQMEGSYKLGRAGQQLAGQQFEQQNQPFNIADAAAGGLSSGVSGGFAGLGKKASSLFG